MIADAKRGFWSTNAPLVIRNHMIVGVAGDFDNLPGILKSFDPDTGKLQWTFYSTPPPGTPGSIARRCHRRADVDDWHLRSGAESSICRHRQSDAGAERRSASRRQPVDLFDRRDQSRHGQAGVGISGVTARHARLGRGRSAGARRRQLQRHAAQDGVAGVAQRLLLRARSHHRQEPRDDAVRGGQLGEGDRQRRPAHPESRQGTET